MRAGFKYSFEHLTDVIDQFTEALELKRYAIYVFDYGAPVGSASLYAIPSGSPLY